MNYKELISQELFNELVEAFDLQPKLMNNLLETGRIDALADMSEFSIIPAEFIHFSVTDDDKWKSARLDEAELCIKRRELYMQVCNLTQNMVD